MASSDTVLSALKLLAAAYPNAALRDETPEVFILTLADVDDGLLKAAVQQHIASSRFFPTVAELRELMLALRRRESGDDESGAGAWERVMRAIDRFGNYRAAEARAALGDEIWLRLEVAGGFQRVCLSENVAADRARFIENYDTTVRRRRFDEQLLPGVRKALDAARVKALPAGGNEEE